LPAQARLWETKSGRAAFEAAICAMPLERPPGAQSVYSDPGFMLLGFVLENLDGRSLADQFASAVAANITDDLLSYLPNGPRADFASLRPRIAPTENDPWRGRLLCGEVHDENAAALGGVAGHAGLFGTVTAVGAFARTVLQTLRGATWLGEPTTMRTFAARTSVPGSSRALGWDTMLPTSSCGTLMSPTAIGHTGFTGTSLWIDDAQDLYVALLTNRVHPSRSNEALVAMRPKIHDAVMRDVQ
jgi:CubicO group peptidase (beta-lactamase class C family)